MRVVLVFVLTLLASGTTVLASSDAGVRIRYGEFEIAVLYSVAGDYAGSDVMIQDPGKALFDVLAFLWVNRETLYGRREQVEVYFHEGDFARLWRTSWTRKGKERSTTKKYVVEGSPEATLRRILSELSEGGCRGAEAVATVRLCPAGEGAGDDRIRFGSFPSTSLNERFMLEPPKGCCAVQAAQEATRDGIDEKFPPLE